MKLYRKLLTVFLLLIVHTFAYADTPSSRPDSHAPIGVMGADMSPSHRPDFHGGTRLDFAVSSNLMMPAGNPLAGQRIAVEFTLPIYQNLTGTQLKNRWRLILGWQYAFRL